MHLGSWTGVRVDVATDATITASARIRGDALGSTTCLGVMTPGGKQVIESSCARPPAVGSKVIETDFRGRSFEPAMYLVIVYLETSLVPGTVHVDDISYEVASTT
jgi:hypothetical protein